MDFEWDESKRMANLIKHRIDFVRVRDAFDGPMRVRLDSRSEYGEDRLKALGWIQGRPIVVVYTERGEVIRIISARKATQNEEAEFFSEAGS
jgi:uncharacterized DUF497 family protein